MPSLSRIQTPALGNSGAELGMRNRIINGAMMIDQRNTAVTPVGTGYSADRWAVTAAAGGVFTLGQSSVAPTGFKNSLVATSLSAHALTTNDTYGINQPIEGFNTADFAWGTASAVSITVSFWVRCSLTGAFGGAVINSAADRSYTFAYTINSANTWEYKTVTIPGDTSGTWLTNNSKGVELRFGVGSSGIFTQAAGSWGTANAVQPSGQVNFVGTSGATFYITGVQLEKGSTATSFDYRPYGAELALCQRYYYRVYDSVPQYYTVANGVNYNTTGGASVPIPYLPMRATPSATLVSGLLSYSGNGGSTSSFTLVPYSGLFSINYAGTSLQSWGVANINNSSATALTVALSAEL